MFPAIDCVATTKSNWLIVVCCFETLLRLNIVGFSICHKPTISFRDSVRASARIVPDGVKEQGIQQFCWTKSKINDKIGVLIEGG